ncbi:MAG: Gfo/Idh/MocA family oxidoreductase [Victivallales bacterium]|nr:Gfo/Idh/MocA family oxidoreductase [Victivallales bacterium]
MESKIRVGILGLGRAGRYMHAPELSLFPDFFEIAAGCDHAADRRENLPEQFRNARIYSDYQEMLADSSLELITVATRNADHTPHALMALEAGKAVVIDKPFAISMEQGEALLQAARKYPGKLFFRLNRRFESPFLMMQDVVKSGVLGNISMVKIHRHPGYVRRYDWQTLTEFKGGLLNNWGPHFVDQALQFLDSPVKDVWCKLSHIVGGGDADDQVKIVLVGENDCVVDIEISTILTIYGNLYEIWGSRGSMVIPADGLSLKLKYLDPSIKFTRLDGVRGNFALQYGNPEEKLTFIEESRPVPADEYGHLLQRGKVIEPGKEDPDQGYTYPDTMWYHVYQALKGNAPYPITAEEAYNVIKVMMRAHEVADYKPSVLEYQ